MLLIQKLLQILLLKKELIKDSTGYDQTKITRIEKTIYSEIKGDKLEFVDSSTPDSVVLEINCGGCKIDIPIYMEKNI